jgi:hypothetical protein
MAGRLLAAIAADDPSLLRTLALRARVGVAELERCRDGAPAALDWETQLRLAALVVELAPRHARLAHRLFSHAQAALQMELLDGRRHLSNPKTEFY